MSFRRVLAVAALAVCLLTAAEGAAWAQPLQSISSNQIRQLTRACGRTGAPRDCFSAVRGSLRGVADLVLAELRTSPEPRLRPVSGATNVESVVKDGTFMSPVAPRFSVLKAWANAGGVTGDACAGLPPELRADRDRLQRLICDAEQELSVHGPDRWPDEERDLEDIRSRLARCLPPATPNPCAAP
jgi:hypothetical protein